MQKIIVELQEIKNLLKQSRASSKGHLNISEASEYLGLSTSYLYKLTSSRAIPFYVPNGKVIYFKKSDLDEWIIQNKYMSLKELDEKAETYINTNRRVVK